MSERDDAPILEKIRKLLAMTTANGCSEHEAANAARMAARLMLEHGIEQERLGAKSENEEHKFAFSRGADQWQRMVAGGVAKKFGCAVYADFDGVVFFGRGEAPQGAGEVWTWLVHEMPRIALQQKAWKHGDMQKYMLGMATTVCFRLNVKDRADTDRFAIVRAETADEEMTAAHPELEETKELAKRLEKDSDSVAFLVGMLDGAKVPLGTEKALQT